MAAERQRRVEPTERVLHDASVQSKDSVDDGSVKERL